MPLNALNFDLQISPDGDGYRAEVVASPSGTPTARFVLPLSPADQDGFVGQLLDAGNRGSDLFTEGRVKAFGRHLFEALFHGEILASFLRSRDRAEADGVNLRLRLRLNNVPALLNLPWEFLYDPSRGQFLAHSTRNPLVHFLQLPDPPRPTVVDLPLRVLVAVASPQDLPKLDAAAEFAHLNQALSPMIQAGQVAVERLDGVTYAGLQQRLSRGDVHVLHFVGHGQFDEPGGQGFVVLCKDDGSPDLVTGEALGRLLQNARSLRLVLLNACEGSRTGTADPFAGVAQILVQQGIPAVVAMQFRISDKAAIAFASSFYTGLADGQPIDVALTHARVAISRLPGSEWGTPRLFMNAEDGRLWDLATSASGLGGAGRDAAQTDRGLTALVDLMRRPEVRAAVVAFETDLAAASHQIDLLASLKELHDHLHNVEFQCYRVIQQEATRFPADDLAAENLADNELTLLDLVGKVQAVAQREVLKNEETGWAKDLAEADRLLQEALAQSQAAHLKRCVQLLKRLLTREPSRINERLNRTAGMLRLEQIEFALAGVAARLIDAQTDGGLDQERLAQFTQGVTALGRLRETVAQAVESHSRWQSLDVELRRVDAVLVHDLDDLIFTWPDVRTLTRSLCQDVNEPWAEALGREEAQLDQALQAENPVLARRYFFRFRRQAGLRFYQVDTDLKDLCGELATIAAPLDSVLHLLG